MKNIFKKSNNIVETPLFDRSIVYPSHLKLTKESIDEFLESHPDDKIEYVEEETLPEHQTIIISNTDISDSTKERIAKENTNCWFIDNAKGELMIPIKKHFDLKVIRLK